MQVPVTVAEEGLLPPKPEKMFLISPPCSPPVGWEQTPESHPVINMELIQALSRLNPGMNMTPCDVLLTHCCLYNWKQHTSRTWLQGKGVHAGGRGRGGGVFLLMHAHTWVTMHMHMGSSAHVRLVFKSYFQKLCYRFWIWNLQLNCTEPTQIDNIRFATS